MLMTISKRQQKKDEKELIKFCKDNHCLMYNYMRTIERIRNEPKDEILMRKLKKQAEDYHKSVSPLINKTRVKKNG